MTITQGVCDSFKKEILQALHDFTASTGHTFKIALYSSSASLSPSTTEYSATDEISATGYTAGGATLTSVTPAVTSGVAYVDFDDVTWSGSSISAAAALIYNSSASNKAVVVLDFGGTAYANSEGNFIVRMPAADKYNAIIRVGD